MHSFKPEMCIRDSLAYSYQPRRSGDLPLGADWWPNRRRNWRTRFAAGSRPKGSQAFCCVGILPFSSHIGDPSFRFRNDMQLGSGYSTCLRQISITRAVRVGCDVTEASRTRGRRITFPKRYPVGLGHSEWAIGRDGLTLPPEGASDASLCH